MYVSLLFCRHVLVNVYMILTLHELQQGTGLLNRYGGSLRALLAHTLPEIFVTPSPTQHDSSEEEVEGPSVHTKKDKWASNENRRQFLLDLANKMGFDPMVQRNWKGKTAIIQANQVKS